MRLEDLMIGDLVYTTREYFWCEDNVCSSRECDKRYIRLQDITDLYLSDNFEPIPFDERYILDLRWTKRVPTDAYELQYLKAEYISPDGRLMIHDGLANSEKRWYIHIDNADFETIGSGEFNNLHELQHILKCCGLGEVSCEFLPYIRGFDRK